MDRLVVIVLVSFITLRLSDLMVYTARNYVAWNILCVS